MAFRLLKTPVRVLVAVFLALASISVQVHAQDIEKNKIAVPIYGISLNLGGAIPIGITFDHTLTNRISAQISLGAGYSGGIRYSISNPSKRRLCFFTGIHYTSMEMSEYSDTNGEVNQSVDINGHSLYVPLGISYLGKRNFQYSLEAGPFLSRNYLSLTLGIKVGYRFAVDYEKIKSAEKTSKRNIISGSILGMTPIIGVVYERLLTPYLGVDVGIGLPSIGAGFKYYFPQIREDKWNLHVGASHHFFVFPWAGGWKTYFPIGLSRMAKNGFRIGFDLGPQLSWYENIGSNSDLFFNGNIRIGKAF